MSIKKYTNFNDINLKAKNEGHFIADKDLFIVTKGEVEGADFGDCKYDVMEVAVYDINNNLLPQKSGETVSYIKTGDIKYYMYNVTNKGGQRELAIDIEKLLKDLGFTNGILRVNINFVRSRVGTENDMRRVWIQEISPSRQEVRIIPLKTADTNINKINEYEFNNLKNLHKDFKYYRASILDSLTSFENNFLDSINSNLETRFGKDFFNTLKNDFGLKNFNDLRKTIFEDFKTSVEYYLTNKNYDITQSNFGKPSEIRFIDCDQYDFNPIIQEMENILYKCIMHSSYFLKRRDIEIKETPKEFKVVELDKTVKNNLDSFQTPVKQALNVYTPPPVETVIIPPKVIVETPPNTIHYEYIIKNTSSLKSYLFKFTNVAGQSMQKILGPGKSATICALEGSISPSPVSKGVLDDDSASSLQKRISPLPQVEWDIKKLAICKTLDITDTAPTPSPTTTVETPPVVATPKPPIVVTQPPKQTVTPQPTSTGGGCFVEGTLVTLANGAKIVIEEVVKGMEVLTWNEENGQQEVGIVTDLIRPMSSDIITIDLGDDTIECTTDHPIFVVGKGWASFNPMKTKEVHKMEVAELVDGDLVLDSSDQTLVIHSISPLMTLVPIQTYNLTIDGNHTYYANNVLVHNKLYSGGGGGGVTDGNLVTNNTDTPGGRDIQINVNNNTGLPTRTGSTRGNIGTRQQSFG